MDLYAGVPRQGQLGDCWLVAVLAGLCVRCPHLVRSLVQPFGLQFRVNLLGFYILVDATFPLINGVWLGIDPNVCLWAALIEKGFALIRGGYQMLNGGIMYDAVRLLLPTARIRNGCYRDASPNEIPITFFKSRDGKTRHVQFVQQDYGASVFIISIDKSDGELERTVEERSQRRRRVRDRSCRHVRDCERLVRDGWRNLWRT